MRWWLRWPWALVLALGLSAGAWTPSAARVGPAISDRLDRSARGDLARIAPALGGNLLRNGDFETGSQSPWAPYHAITAITTTAHSGAFALQARPWQPGQGLYYIVDAMGIAPFGTVPSGVVATQAGTYVATVWMRGVPGRTLRACLRDGTASIVAGIDCGGAAGTGGWESITVSHVVASASDNLDLWVGGENYQQGDVFSVDDASLSYAGSPAPTPTTPPVTPTPTPTRGMATPTPMPTLLPPTPTPTRAVATPTPPLPTSTPSPRPSPTPIPATPTSRPSATPTIPFPTPTPTAPFPTPTSTAPAPTIAVPTATPTPPNVLIATATPSATRTPLAALSTSTPVVAPSTPVPTASSPPAGAPAPAPLPPTPTRATSTPPLTGGAGSVAAGATPTPTPARIAPSTATCPTVHASSGPRLQVDVSPSQARPGETVQVRARYVGRASVRVVLSYGGRVLTTIAGRADGHGTLTLRLRAPARLRRGAGTATLRVSALAGARHATASVSLPVRSLTLMGTIARVHGRPVAELRVAYLAGARIRLNLTGPHGWHRALTLVSDRHGVATARVSLPHLWRGALHLRVQAKGRQGRDHGAESIVLALTPPRRCR